MMMTTTTEPRCTEVSAGQLAIKIAVTAIQENRENLQQLISQMSRHTEDHDAKDAFRLAVRDLKPKEKQWLHSTIDQIRQSYE